MTINLRRIVASPIFPMLVLMASVLAHADTIYDWTPGRFHPGGNVSAVTVTRPSGASTLQITTLGEGYNHFIVTSRGLLKGGHDYTAVVSYEVATATKFPDAFYMFARSSSLGQTHDVWQNWLGQPGVPAKERMSMSLPAADDWTFYVGCKGPGSIIIDGCTINDGTGYVYVPASATSVSKAVLASGEHGEPLPTGCGAVTIAPPAPTKHLVLSAKDFGLVADGATGAESTDVATANFAAITAALAAVVKQGASELVIPKGTYRFYSTTSIPLEDLSDVTIDGQGSDFIFEKIHPPFAAIGVASCKRCVFKNLNIDWDWTVTPIATLGQVTAVASDHLSADITLPDDSAAETDLVTKSPWMSMFPIDPKTLCVPVDMRMTTRLDSVAKTGDNTVHAVFKQPVNLVAGQYYGIRHLYYDMGAFRVSDSSDVLFDNDTIYSIPGMGWFNRGEMKNWELHDCRIVRRPGSRHIFTTAADGFHVMESLGGIILDGCEFTGLGDDCVNIHDICFEGVQRVDDNTLTLLNNPRYRLKVNVGDTIELYNADYSPLGYSSPVTAIKYVGQDTTLTLAKTLPATVLGQSIIYNHHYDTTNVRIVNCNFHDTTGRGILFSGEYATVENCTFDHTFNWAFQFETEIVGYLWAEGHGASNVVIRNNVFKGEGYRGRFDGATIYAGSLIPSGPSSYPLFRDSLIEDNRFIDCLGPTVSLSSTKNMIVRDNIIGRSDPDAPTNSLSGSIFAAYSSNLTANGNIWRPLPPAIKPGVVYDPGTTSEIACTGNAVTAIMSQK